LLCSFTQFIQSKKEEIVLIFCHGNTEGTALIASYCHAERSEAFYNFFTAFRMTARKTLTPNSVSFVLFSLRPPVVKNDGKCNVDDGIA
jgi:hypothetical protein